MRKFILFIGFAFAVLKGFTQPKLVDSLTQVLNRTTDQRQQVDILHELSSASWDYSFEQGLQFAKRGMVLAEQINYTSGRVNALADQGLYYYFIGSFGQSLQVLRQAYLLGNKEPDRFKAMIAIRMGNAHRLLGNTDSARYYYGQARVRLQESKPTRTLSLLYFGEGMLEYELGNLAAAKQLLQRSLQVRKVIADSLFIAESWRALGMVASSNHDYDSADWYFEKSRRVAERYQNPELMTFYYLNKGELYFNRGMFPEATRAYISALDSLNKHDYKIYRSIALKNIGEIFEWRGNYELALKYFYDAIMIEKSMNLQHELARTYDMMGWVYANQGNLEKAYEVANQSALIRRNRKDEIGLSHYYNLFGYIKFKSELYQEAITYYDSSLAIRRMSGTPILILNTLDFKSKAALAYHQYEDAIRYQREVFEIATKVGNKNALASHYNTMCGIRLAQKKYKEAEQYGLLAMQLAKEIGGASIERTACQRLSEVLTSLGKPEEAIRYYKRYINISDSLYSIESVSRQAQFEALYQLEQHEDEIEQLQERASAQQELLTVQQEKLRFRNATLIFVALACLLLAGFAFALYRLYKTKATANKLLNLLNHEITEQKEEIQAQAEELTEANAALVNLYHDLQEKTEEIQVQSEELRETNNMIVEINRDLDDTVTKRTAQLQEAYKELDTFFYRSSHDFRRPLTTFMGLAEVAKITVKDEAALELFQKVNETARSLDKMLVKLQSISDVGTQQLIYKEVMIKEIFNSVCDSFNDQIRQQSIQVSCEVTLTRPFVSYPGMIKVIFENLIENSIYFSQPTTGLINLRAKDIDNQCCIAIEDNGPGIAPNLHQRIFDMYFRGSERSKGNGLGLYIVKKAVEKLGGEITLDSSFTYGTRFLINIPMDMEISRQQLSEEQRWNKF